MAADLHEHLRAARKGGYAVGSFNVFNFESMAGAIAAAEATATPVILALSESHLKYIDVDVWHAAFRILAAKSRVPVMTQLDHAKTESVIERAIALGFDSVMWDGYDLPLNEKVAQTKHVVELAHRRGVVVEAPLGRIGKTGTAEVPKYPHDGRTDPGLVAEFVSATGIDILAVAIGTTHGLAQEQASLDLARLDQIRARTGCYLSLHGGSGVKNQEYGLAIARGINKISIFTRVSTAAVTRMVAVLKETTPRFPDLLLEARQAVKEEIAEMIGYFGGVGRAK